MFSGKNVGSILGFLLLETHFYVDKTLSYCGRKKTYPHDIASLNSEFRINNDVNRLHPCRIESRRLQ